MDEPLEESEESILANIKTPEKLANYIKLFTKYVNQIVKGGIIKGSTKEQTDKFINEFIPKLVDAILSSKAEHSQGKIMNDYLVTIIPLFVNFIFDKKKSKLVEKCSDIISKVKSPFYISTMPYHVVQNNSISPFFDNNLTVFGKTNIIQLTINEMKNMTIDDFNSYFYSLKLIHKNRRYFDQRSLNLLVHSTTDFYEKIFNSIEESKLRKLNEKDTNESFDDLVQLAPESIQDHKNFEKIHFDLSLRYVKTPFLNKRYYGLSFIKTVLNFGIIDRDLLCSKLESEKIITYVLDNMHDELVTDFCSIFRVMALKGSIVESQLSRFWDISIHQNPLTIEPYFSGWNLIYTGLPKNLKVSLWSIMVKSDIYPIAALKFIKKASQAGIEDDQKVPLFYVLKDYYQNCSESEVLEVLSDTLSSLVPDNLEFTENLQKECFKLFKEQKQLDLALSLFKASFKNSVDSEKARQSFDLIMSSISGVENINNIQFLEVIEKVLKRMKGGLNDQEFSSLLQLLIRTIKIDSDSVFRFYQSIVLKDSLIKNEQNIQLFTEICKLDVCDLQTQNFIIYLFNKINKGNFCSSSLTNKSIPKDATIFVGIEDLWNVCLKTNGSKISFYLCQLYSNSKKVSNIKVYIQHCMENADKPSALLAICNIIHFVESNFEKSLLGINENRYIPQFDYVSVKLIGDVNLTIKVPHDISFCAFRDRVSSITGIERERLTFYEGVNMIQKQSFVLFDSLQLEVRKWNSTIRKIPDVEKKYLPSIILSKEKYQKKLFKLLVSEDDRIARPAFEILNQLPTSNQEIELLTSENPDWNEIFLFKNKHLLYYRVHAIGHLAENNENIPNTNTSWIDYFYETGGTKSLFDHAFNNIYNPMEYIKPFSIFLEICNLIISKMEDKEKKKTILTKDVIDIIIQRALKISKDDEYESLLLLLLSILDKFSEADSSFILTSPSFRSLFVSTIFSSNKLIRVLISSIVKRINLNDFNKDLFALLETTVHLKCKEYFSLILPLVKTYQDQSSLFKKIKKIIYREYFISDNENPLLALTFIPPNKYFTWGIFSVAYILIQSLEKVSGTTKLFNFIIDHILFNNLCYFEVNSDFFSFLSYLIKNDPSLLRSLLPKMKNITEISPNLMKENGIHLSHSLKPKGLINLGATCYMNSSIQQLFNIPEFRNEILNSRNGDDIDWFYHLQFLLAQLLLYPTDCIDPSHFVHNWKWYDNELVNVHEQMDAGEFINLLLSRASDIVPNCDDCFKGIIYHDIVGTEVDFHSESIENFTVLPLEVKDHGSLEESLQSFLIPDEFIGDNMYNADGIGRINANRYHSLMKTPDVLIIQLKRFTYSLLNGEREKLNSRFEFPMELDLEPIMTENVNKAQQQQKQKQQQESKKKFYQSSFPSMPSLSLINAKIEEEEEKRKREEIERSKSQNMFDLIGVQMHMGDALSGHYFLYSDSSTGWYKYDDNYVGKFDPNRLKYLAFGGIQPASYGDPRGIKIENNENAYILYYRKRKPKIESQTKEKSLLIQKEKIKNKTRNDEEEEEEEEEDYNNENLSDENDNIQFDSYFPDINEKVRKELQDDVLNIIASQKITNPQSRDFLLNSVDLSDDPIFQFDYLVELIQNAVHKQIILSILHKMDGLVMSSNECAQKLLENSTIHKDLIVKNERHEVRQKYSKIIIHAIDKVGYQELYLNFLEELMNSEVTKNRNEIGLPLEYIIEKYRKDFESEKWLNNLFNYIEKVKTSETDATKINVSSMLDSIRLLLLSPKTTNETKEKYKNVIFNVNFFGHLFQTKSNSRALFNLLLVYKGDNTVIQGFFDKMKSNWEQISPQNAAVYFTMLVLLNNEASDENLDWFFKSIKKQPNEFIETFIQELETSAVDGMASVFLNYSKLWVKTFLFSLSEKVRLNLNDLFCIIFKENNENETEFTNETETETEIENENETNNNNNNNQTESLNNQTETTDSSNIKTENTESTANFSKNENDQNIQTEANESDNEKSKKKKKHKRKPLSIDLRKSRRMSSKELKSKPDIDNDDDMKKLTILLVKNFSTLSDLVIKRNNKKASLYTTGISTTKIYPYATFLDLFSMTIRRSNSSHKVALHSSKEILDALKKLYEVDMIGVEVIKQFMNLLLLIITNKKEGKEFFSNKLYMQLLSILSSISFDQATRLTSINDVSCLISITPSDYVTDFFKSSLFEDSVYNCLNSTTDFAPVFAKYIIDNTTEENSLRVTAVLWSDSSFKKNVTNAPQYFYVTSEILRKFPHLAVNFMQSKHADHTLVAVTKSLLITEDEFSLLGAMQTLAFASFIAAFQRFNSSSKNKVKFYDSFLEMIEKDFEKIKQITDRFYDIRNRKEVFYSIAQLLVAVYPINSKFQDLVINTISKGVFSYAKVENASAAGELLEYVIFMLSRNKDQKNKAIDILMNEFESLSKNIKKNKKECASNNERFDGSLAYVATEILSSEFLSLLGNIEIESKTMTKFNDLYVNIFNSCKNIRFFSRSTILVLTKFENEEVKEWRKRCSELIPDDVRRIIRLQKKSQYFSNPNNLKDDTLQILKYALEFAYVITNNNKVSALHKTTLTEIEISQFLEICRELPDPSANDLSFLVSKLLQH